MHYIRLFGLIVVSIMVVLIPLFTHSPYYLDLIILIMLNSVLAMTFVMLLRVGLINLSITAFWGMGAYISAILIMNYDFPFWASLPASALVTGAIAWGLGYILIGRRSTGFSFVILSAVMGMLFTIVVSSISFLGGYIGIHNIPPPDPINMPFLPTIIFVSKVQYFYLMLILFVVIILICKALYSSWTGPAWAATGLDHRLAESVGINTFRFRMFAFTLASAIAGLMGSFYASYQGFIAPTTFGMWRNIYIQIYAILGGVGFVVSGPIIGSAVMTFLTEFLRPFNVIAPLITGILLIILIVFLPQGLLGLLQYKNIVTGWRLNTTKTREVILSAFHFK